MLIVIDTNALVSIVRSNLAPLQELTSYAKRYGGVVILPEVVRTEFSAYLERHLSETQNKLKSIVNRLPEADEISEHLSKILEAAEGAKVKLPSKLHELERRGRLLPAPIRTTHARRAVARAASRRPPCSASGEEVRDALIWEASLDLLKQHRGPLVLVSNDKTFQSDALVTEVQSLGRELLIYDSIETFMRETVFDEQAIPADVLQGLSNANQLAALLAIHAAEDPFGSWEAMIGNFIEGGVLDLIAGDYKIRDVSKIFVAGGVRRPIGRNAYHAYVAFEADVWLQCEAFGWKELPPGEYQPSDELQQDPLLLELCRVVPVRQSDGKSQVVDIDIHVHGEVAYLVNNSIFEPEPLDLYATPIAAGFHGEGFISHNITPVPDE
jgi:rRNA-processing protein FCF1